MLEKIFKFAVKSIAVIAVIFIVKFIYTAATFDFSELKASAEKLATEKAGKPVAILGDMSWGLMGFNPSVNFDDVVVGNKEKPSAVLGKLSLGIPLSNLRSYLATGNASAVDIALSRLTYEGQDIGDIKAPVRFSGNGLSIKPLTVKLPHDGTIEADVDYQDNNLKLTAKAEDVDYALIIPGASGGDLGGTLELTGNGATIDDVLTGLNGKVALSGGKGQLSGDAISLWASDLLSKVMTGTKKHTDVTCLLLNGNIKNGVLTPSQAVLDTDSVLVRATGSIDLGRQRLKLLVTPSPKDAALLSLATPLRVEGAWDNPSVLPDKRAVLEKVGGLVLGAVAPPAALLAFGSTGDKSSLCAAVEK